MSAPRSTAVGENLSYLCNGQSIAEVCRAIGVNRQQFNKYLSGRHVPSRRNLAQICRYFRVSEKDVFQDHQKFVSMYRAEESGLLASFLRNRRAVELLGEIAEKNHDAHHLVGFYHRYHYSSIYSGAVLRSALEIYDYANLLQYYYVERFPDLDKPRRTAYVFKYHGLCVYRGDRLFLIDSEVIQRNEMTFSIVVPVTRSKKRFLYGLTSGVAATPYREPFATKVALEFKGQSVAQREHLKAATTLSPDDKSIPIEVMNYLGRPLDSESAILRGR
jgi:transcriptional regulator with XRE-family HTH domain